MRRAMTTAACALLLAAGCGNDSARDGVATLGGGAAPTASASTDPHDAFRQFARCMREHGVDMPDPGTEPDDAPVMLAPSAAPQQMRAADEACRHFLKDAIAEDPKVNDPAMHDKALKFARCMREHGIDLPDPGSDGAIQKRIGDGDGDVGKPPFDPESPTFKAAQRACGHLFEVEVTG